MSISFKSGRSAFLALVLVGVLHCGGGSLEAYSSLNADSGGSETSQPGTGVDADVRVLPPNAAEAGALDSLASGILLVNASDSFPAFRICPVTKDETGTFSSSQNVPIPTKLMPRSNLAGVGVGGATTIAAQKDFAGDSDVLLLKIDDVTKNKAEQLATESCRSLACTEVGASCLGAGNVVRVPLVDMDGKAVPGALATPGKILALRGDATSLRLEVIPVDNDVDDSARSKLTVKFRNISSFVGPVTYTLPTGSATPLTASTAIVLDPSDSGFVTSKFTAGGYAATLSDVHQNSDPRASITDFYSSPGAFALVLVGSEADVGADRKLRFLAVPVTAPKLPLADAGAPDSAVPTGDQ